MAYQYLYHNSLCKDIPRLKNVSVLGNLPARTQHVVLDNCNELLDKLNEKKFSKPKGGPPYFVEMIDYGLNLRET